MSDGQAKECRAESAQYGTNPSAKVLNEKKKFTPKIKQRVFPKDTIALDCKLMEYLDWERVGVLAEQYEEELDTSNRLVLKENDIDSEPYGERPLIGKDCDKDSDSDDSDD